MVYLLPEIDMLLSRAKPKYEPWDNTTLLKRYLESIVYGRESWDNDYREAVIFKLFEIQQQLEEESFDFEGLNQQDNEAIPIWLIVHRFVDITPIPVTAQKQRKEICFKVLADSLAPTVYLKNRDDYPIDPKKTVTQSEYIQLWKQFKGGLNPQLD